MRFALFRKHCFAATRFIYEYDFGDSWQHEILLERILEPEPNVAYPRCITRGAVCSGDDHLAVTEDEGECCECRPTTTPSPGSASGRSGNPGGVTSKPSPSSGCLATSRVRRLSIWPAAR